MRFSVYYSIIKKEVYIMTRPRIWIIICLCNINAGLKTGGIFVLDGGGPEDNIFSNCWDGLFLRGEKHVMTLRKSISAKSWHRVEKAMHGFKHKDTEIISIAEDSGFELVELQKFDFLYRTSCTERLYRSSCTAIFSFVIHIVLVIV